MKIESERMILRLGADTRAFPRIGEKVTLEVHLPVNSEVAGAKDLSIRGQVVGVTEMRDGAREFELSFRRAQFKDRVEVKRKGSAAAATNGGEVARRKTGGTGSEFWEM